MYFLDSTYKWYHTVVLFLCLFQLANALQVHPCCCKWQNFILFCGWVVFHCVYIPRLLYPFICWWTLRLLPYCAIYFLSSFIEVSLTHSKPHIFKVYSLVSFAMFTPGCCHHSEEGERVHLTPEFPCAPLWSCFPAPPVPYPPCPQATTGLPSFTLH